MSSMSAYMRRLLSRWIYTQPQTWQLPKEETRKRRRAASAKAAARKRAERDASTTWRACLRCEEPFLSKAPTTGFVSSVAVPLD